MNQVLTLKAPLPNLGGQPHSYTSQEWEAHRSEIKRLYADQNIPLKDVVQIMKTRYSFFATYVSSSRTRMSLTNGAPPDKDSIRLGYIDGDWTRT